jgi:hypothetical protein
MQVDRAFRWLFSSAEGARDRLIPRWLFLRALAGIYFSAFLAMAYQARGLIGPDGIFPVRPYLDAVTQHFPGVDRFWYAPSVFWLGSGLGALHVVTWIGLIASMLLFFNVWPRATLLICFVCFLSFIVTLEDFSSYQSDGMLLEAGFISLFLTPAGLLPGLGANSPPARAPYFLLLWEWFRIYFQSGAGKLLSGDPQWRNMTAMDDYYQNGPLPTWIGWYVAHFPHWVHAASALATLVIELGVVWMMFLPRRWRIVCFCIVTPWEIGVILTANYAFLNYLVLALGFLLLDDRFCAWVVGWATRGRWTLPVWAKREHAVEVDAAESAEAEAEAIVEARPERARRSSSLLSTFNRAVACVFLVWVFYVTTAKLALMLTRTNFLPMSPIIALEPFRIANSYGLFEVMTRARYEVEYQGSNDGQTWIAYMYRFKPQALNERPGIYAPYQPRFDWNMWFASLGTWQSYIFVPETESALLKNDAGVLTLFRGNPFAQAPPKYVRAVVYQYWFTSMAEKRATGNWWKRQLLGLYAPEITLKDNGHVGVVAWADAPAMPSYP